MRISDWSSDVCSSDLLRALLFGDEGEHSLRKELEDAIDEYDEEEHGAVTGNGDLSPVERQMLKNLLHFGEHTVDDVAVPRADIIAIEESASFDELVALFAEARSEEHTSELQSLMRISYAVFCLKKNTHMK